jgi:DNA invertase Pin-like site-specific DNA recombinase
MDLSPGPEEPAMPAAKRPPVGADARPPTAFSYLRFSTREQRKGDSTKRQTEGPVEWCQRNGVPLDTALTLHDKGCSAFKGLHRENPDKHALALFLKLVELGRVRPGDFLVIENLDRLTREEEVPACHLLTGILMAGVRVVQLSPYEMVLTEKSNGWELMRAVMELSRGHGESALKSERVSHAWASKRQAARESRKILTTRLPAWVQERGGKLELIPDRAAVVRRIFHLSAAGYGNCSIVRKLVEEGVPSFGRSDHWSRSYVALILVDRRALGEFDPRLQDGTPDGPPAIDYFPRVVSEDEFNRARAGAAVRKKKRGRVGTVPNLFQGMLRHARDGDSYFAVTNTGRSGRRRVLVNLEGHEGRAKRWYFPLDVFEAAVLSLLAEIDPREVLNGGEAADEVGDLAGRHAAVEAAIALIEADLDKHGESPTLFKRLRAKEDELRDLAGKLREARQKAAHPLSESWGETQTLLAALGDAPDQTDARLRLRSALRRIVDSERLIWLLVVARGRARVAAVQINFSGGHRRDFLILYRPAKANASARTEGGWHAWSMESIVKAGEADLSDRKSVKRLVPILEGLDLDALDAVGEK